MDGERDAAARTLRRPSAAAAEQRARAAAPVHEEQAFLAALEPLAERLNERAAEDPAIAAFELLAQIDDAHGRQRLRGRSFAQLQQRDPAAFRGSVAF